MVAEKLAAIVTTGDLDRLANLVVTCQVAAKADTQVTIFFRDESIPVSCRAEVRQRLGLTRRLDGKPDEEEARYADLARKLKDLADVDNVALYACSSSLYLWGVTVADLIPALAGARGLIAFLADDLDGAGRVLSY